MCVRARVHVCACMCVRECACMCGAARALPLTSSVLVCVQNADAFYAEFPKVWTKVTENGHLQANLVGIVPPVSCFA